MQHARNNARRPHFRALEHPCAPRGALQFAGLGLLLAPEPQRRRTWLENLGRQQTKVQQLDHVRAEQTAAAAHARPGREKRGRALQVRAMEKKSQALFGSGRRAGQRLHARIKCILQELHQAVENLRAKCSAKMQAGLRTAPRTTSAFPATT